MKIGVFDSGVGGRSVATAIQKSLVDHEVIYTNDRANVPYGNKSPEQLLKLVSPILAQLVAQGCEVIVIACNTVSTTILDELRSQLIVPLIGVEPMIREAADYTTTKVIAVCATPTTLASHRYSCLKQQYAKELTILEPDCSNWAFLIENNIVDRHRIETVINMVCDKGADVVVLGCTHYHWIEDLIKEITSERAVVIQPEATIITEIRLRMNI